MSDIEGAITLLAGWLLGLWGGYNWGRRVERREGGAGMSENDDLASTMLMDAADFLAETLAKPDPRAWEHLLVYAPRRPTPDVEAVARAIYDRREGKGAFDQEKAIREAEGMRWPTASFQGVFADARAAIAAMERK